MALGVIKIIPASSHAQFSLTGGGTAGGGNPYPSATVLNPNDGVAYIAQNRDCIGTGYGSWDWKVPSQSYALLPGPFTSIGVYYLDQSGAGRQGEITIYPSQRAFDVPLFNAIGRSILAQITTLDITEGTQPPSPSIGVNRIWSDSTGRLYALLSDGTLRELAELQGASGLLQLQNIGTIPTTGKGLELFGYQPTPAGGVQAVNRDAGGTYIELDLRGNPVRINPSGEGLIQFGSNLVPFPLSWTQAWLASGSNPAANTVNQLVAVTLGVGTWLVTGIANFYNNGASAGHMEIRMEIPQATTIVASGSKYLGGYPDEGSITLAAIVTTASSVQASLSSYDNGNMVIEPNAFLSSPAHATGIQAIRIA